LRASDRHGEGNREKKMNKVVLYAPVAVVIILMMYASLTFG
jgi:hypothetical protein